MEFLGALIGGVPVVPEVGLDDGAILTELLTLVVGIGEKTGYTVEVSLIG